MPSVSEVEPRSPTASSGPARPPSPIERLEAAVKDLYDSLERSERLRAARDRLFDAESNDQYGGELEIDTDWLRRHQPTLRRLMAERFELTLEIEIPGCRDPVERQMAVVDARVAVVLGDNFPGPTRRFQTDPFFRDVQIAWTGAPGGPHPSPETKPLKDLLDILDAPTELTPPRHTVQGYMEARLRLHVFLNKSDALLQLDLPRRRDEGKVLLYLSPHGLLQRLRSDPLPRLEHPRHGLFKPRQRSCIVVLGTRGFLAGDHVDFFGTDAVERLTADCLSAEPSLRQLEDRLDFRRRNCAWQANTSWLTPETLRIDKTETADPHLREVARELLTLRALLALLFLAEDVQEVRSRCYRILFPSRREDALEVSTAAIAEAIGADGDHLADLFELHLWTFDGRSADKLTIVRETAGRWASSVGAFIKDSEKIRKAAKVVHDNYLKKRVKEYLEAQQKVQDYIQRAIADVGAVTLALGRSVAENVFKTLGVVAAVVVAAFLDPEIKTPAATVGALVVGLHLGTVLLYYLPTVRRTSRVGQERFEKQLEPFTNVLGEEEIEVLKGDPHVARAQQLLDDRLTWAYRIYGIWVGLITITFSVLVALWASGGS